MHLHHFGGVILNTPAAYTHTGTTCWFGWLSGKTNGNKTVQSRWKCSQLCLVLLLKSFPSPGFGSATPMPKLCPKYSTFHMKTYFCTIVHYLCIAHQKSTSSADIFCSNLKPRSSHCEPAVCSPQASQVISVYSSLKAFLQRGVWTNG